MRKKSISLPIFCSGEMMNVPIKKMLSATTSEFQEIKVFDTDDFGRCLVINDVMQTAESDHEIYDRELLKLLKKSDRKIIILGGGDGYVAEMALKLNNKLNIKIVDLDMAVVQTAENLLNQKIFKHKNIELYVEDVFRFLKFTIHQLNGQFDGIVCDLTDTPIGRKEKKDFEKFYTGIASFSEKVLKPGGWISLQGGASKVTTNFIDSAKILERILRRKFTQVKRNDILVPSYGESCAFLFGRKA